jgi:hypothetical protein
MAGVFAATDEIARVLESTPGTTGGSANGEAPVAAPAAVDPEAALRSLDGVTERVLDLYAQWDRCRNSGDPTDALVDKQRRLRLAINALPGRTAAVPVIAHLAEADWNDYFRVQTVADVEPDANVEIEAVTADLAHGRVPHARWRIVGTHGIVNSGGRDATAYLWEIARDNQTGRIVVYISGTAMASTKGLPAEVVEAKSTDGRSVVLRYLRENEPPREVEVSTAGIAS